MQNAVWTDAKCVLRSARSIERASIGADVEGGARYRRNDAGDLPAAEHHRADASIETAVATTEGKLVGKALLEVQSAVEVVGRVVAALIDEIAQAAIVPAEISHSLAPGEGGGEAEAAGEPAAELSLERLIVRGRGIEVEVGRSGAPERNVQRFACVAATIGQRIINILN